MLYIVVVIDDFISHIEGGLFFHGIVVSNGRQDGVGWSLDFPRWEILHNAKGTFGDM